MLGQIPTSLRARPSKDENTTGLSSLIQRINLERGGFRNVTEESLQEEINRSTALEGLGNVRKSKEDEIKEEETERLKKLGTARGDVSSIGVSDAHSFEPANAKSYKSST